MNDGIDMPLLLSDHLCGTDKEIKFNNNRLHAPRESRNCINLYRRNLRMVRSLRRQYIEMNKRGGFKVQEKCEEYVRSMTRGFESKKRRGDVYLMILSQ